ncbi:hypothetical protein ACFCXJ_00915 [Streptomyces hydrogenans]|uniref:hypothetical protein n=1 Tax=Streptomyces hydrogenans TaxID=1873719 RepID=UPI0035DAE538
MRTDVDTLLHRLAQQLRPRTEESVETLLRYTRGELSEPWGYDEVADLVAEETAGHVVAFLDLLEHGADAAEAAPPPQSLELARRLARSGVPISTLLRGYRLGHVALLQLVQTEVLTLTDDPELVNAAALRLMAAGFGYVDRSSAHVVAAYQEERDRRLQRRLLLANEAGRRIGTTLDIDRTAQELADVGADGFADLAAVDPAVAPSRRPAIRTGRRRQGASRTDRTDTQLPRRFGAGPRAGDRHARSAPWRSERGPRRW